MIILPEQEQILDFVCGDKEFWVVSGAQNLAYVKPAKAGASTNLNLVTASGNVYSFLLTEGTGEPDLKLYVVARWLHEGGGRQRAGSSTPRPRSTNCVRRPTPPRRTRRRRATAPPRRSTSASTRSRRRTRRSSTFPYRFKANEKPFFVTAIYTDGTFTYIKSDAPELPALYEVRDGAPNLDQLPGRTRRLRRAEGPGERLSVDRQADAGVSARRAVRRASWRPRHDDDRHRLGADSGPALGTARRAAATTPDVADDRPGRHHPRHHSLHGPLLARRRGPRRPRGRPSRRSWRRIASRRINGSSPTTRRVSGANWRRRPAPRAAARRRAPTAWASRARRDPIADEQRRREYQSLFADNVALSRRPADAPVVRRAGDAPHGRTRRWHRRRRCRRRNSCCFRRW